jgi:hypothetical protein
LPSQGNQQANQRPNARHVSSKTAFLVGTAVPPWRLNIFVANEKWDHEKQLAKIKFCFIGHLPTLYQNMPSRDVLRNKSKWIISLIA